MQQCNLCTLEPTNHSQMSCNRVHISRTVAKYIYRTQFPTYQAKKWTEKRSGFAKYWRIRNLKSYAPANVLHWSVANSQPFWVFPTALLVNMVQYCAFSFEISSAFPTLSSFPTLNLQMQGRDYFCYFKRICWRQLFRIHHSALPTGTSGWSEVSEMYTRRPKYDHPPIIGLFSIVHRLPAWEGCGDGFDNSASKLMKCIRGAQFGLQGTQVMITPTRLISSALTDGKTTIIVISIKFTNKYLVRISILF